MTVCRTTIADIRSVDVHVATEARRRRPGAATWRAAAVVAILSLPAAGPVAPAAGGRIAVPAFPGAIGYGRHVTGGRGGRVCHVANLADAGPGSLRACTSATGRRTIVFMTSGTITLESPLAILDGNLTIAGQTAPPPGIQLRMAPYSQGQPMYVKGPKAANVIVRHLKFRPGTPGLNRALVDCFTVENTQDVYLDHISCAFAYDEGLNGHKDVRRVTIGESIIGPNADPHSKGTLWCSDPVRWCGQITEARNLFFTNKDRNPNVDGKGGHKYPYDAVNNYFYNPRSEFAEIWCSNSNNIANNGTHANFVGNIFRPGPATLPGRTAFNFYPDNIDKPCTPYAWQAHNEFDATLVATRQPSFLTTAPIGRLSAPAMTTSAAKAHIRSRVGAFWWSRDILDEQVVADTFAGRGPPRIITQPDQYVGIPTFAVRRSPPDRDRDGMSDAWERRHRFDPAVADNNGDADRDGFTNLEEYLADRARGDQR